MMDETQQFAEHEINFWDVVPYGLNLEAESENGRNMSFNPINLLKSNLTTVFLPVVYIIIIIVGFPANAMAIWIFLFRMKKKHPVSILMINLALADLLFIIWLPLNISYHFNGNNWIFGEPLCKVMVGFFYGNMYCSTIFIACISVQRYWSIVHPLSQMPKKQTIVCISLSVWLVVWLITTPLYLYDQTVYVVNLNITTCHDITPSSQLQFPTAYFLTMGIVGYVVPCVVCIVIYSIIFQFLRNSHTDTNEDTRKVIILIVTVLVMFLVCFSPSNIMLILHYSLQSAEVRNEVYSFYVVTLCLSSLNSCIDPFVYYFISNEFREHFINTLRCRSERMAKRMEVLVKPP